MKQRKINGKLFSFYDVTPYKGEAKSIAKSARKNGYNARVIKTKASRQSGWKQAYQIWIRKR